MSSNTEIDQILKKSMRLLHSSNRNSATELRLMLDDLIKQRYGSEKMLCNTLSKRYLDEEAHFPGLVATPPPAPPPQSEPEPVDEVINLTHSPETIADSDDNMSAGAAAGSVSGTGGMALTSSADDDTNLKDFGDLNCCVCAEMMFTATNRLIECSKCGALYHQECHKPPITDEQASEDQEHNWQCDNCSNKPSTSRSASVVVIPDEPISLIAKAKPAAASSHSSSSSNSSSPFYKQDSTVSSSSATKESSSSKHHHHHHHSHKKSSSSHSSSKSSSKHQEGSSSSKRKTK